MKEIKQLEGDFIKTYFLHTHTHKYIYIYIYILCIEVNTIVDSLFKDGVSQFSKT